MPEKMTPLRVHEILRVVRYPGYTFTVHATGDDFFLQAHYDEPDVITGATARQSTRKWRLSTWMTKSEIVQTALACVLMSSEHRVREHFLYRGERVFGPHFDVDALYEVAAARRLDVRPPPPVDSPRGHE